MTKTLASTTATALLVLPALMSLGGSAYAQSTTETGSMVCDRVPGSGRNLLITSKAEVRCTFKGGDGAEQWYKGESGIGIGLDLKWTPQETIRYGVLSSTDGFTPEGAFLTGNYAGAKAEVAAGVGVGAAVLIGGSDKTTSLKPAIETSEGAGIAAGLGYLNLESDPLNDARMATPSGSTFEQALYSRYFNQALTYRKALHYPGSDEFSARAMATAAGNAPAPAALPDISDPALAAARQRLTNALANPKRDTAPVLVAAAQASYECWAWGVDNVLPATDPSGCLASFDAEMQEVEVRIAAEERVDDAMQALSEPRWFNVYFATDSDTLETHTASVMVDVRDVAGDLLDARIYLAGYTDRTGTVTYNDALSARRTNAVREALLEAGIPATWIATDGFGPRNPVSLSTNPHDALSRRVQITVQPLEVNPVALERARQGG